MFQCWIMVGLSSFSINKYIRKTILPSLFTLLLAWVPLHFIAKLFNDSWQQTIINLTIAVCWTIVAIYIIGTTNQEKQKIEYFIRHNLIKRNKS